MIGISTQRLALDGVSTPDAVDGTPGDDRIDGTDAGDHIFGLQGDDSLQGLGGDDLLVGGPGDDTLLGGSGDDTLKGGAGNNDIDGGSGDDLVAISAVRQEQIDGGSGRDTIDLSAADHGLAIDLLGEDSSFSVLNFEIAIGTEFDDTIYSGPGRDVLHGMGGDDHIQVYAHKGAAPDRLFGDAGDDQLSGTNSPSHMSGGSGRDTLLSGLSGDTLSGGKGGDVFLLAYSPFDGRDDHGGLITDLDDARDVISLRQFDNGGWTIVGGFDGHRHEAMLSYDAGADVTHLVFDIDGDAAGDVTVDLAGDHSGFDNFILS